MRCQYNFRHEHCGGANIEPWSARQAVEVSYVMLPSVNLLSAAFVQHQQAAPRSSIQRKHGMMNPLLYTFLQLGSFSPRHAVLRSISCLWLYYSWLQSSSLINSLSYQVDLTIRTFGNNKRKLQIQSVALLPTSIISRNAPDVTFDCKCGHSIQLKASPLYYLRLDLSSRLFLTSSLITRTVLCSITTSPLDRASTQQTRVFISLRFSTKSVQLHSVTRG